MPRTEQDQPRSYPLQEWKVENFKSIASADLKIAPLNVVVGSNSSGKSSLLQSILLFVQAAQASSTGDNFPLNGPLVSIGDFDGMLTAGAASGRTIIAGTLLGSVASRWSPYGMWGREVNHVHWDITFQGKAENEPGAAQIAQVNVETHVGDLSEHGPGVNISLRRRQPSPGDVEALEAGQSLSPVRVSVAFEGTLSSGDGVPEAFGVPPVSWRV